VLTTARLAATFGAPLRLARVGRRLALAFPRR